MSLFQYSRIASALTVIFFLPLGAASAFEVTTESKLVDNLGTVVEGDWFNGSDLRFTSPSLITMDVSSGGGCKPHDYTLHVSRAVLERFPPVIEAKLTLDKNGDRCKAIVSDAVRFDLAQLGVSGPHFVEVSVGPAKERILVDLETADNAGTATLLPLQTGMPNDFGDPLFSLDNATVIDGIVGSTLSINVTYAGGCEPHEYEAWWDGSYDKSFPPRANIILVHKSNGDVCRSLQNETVQVGVDEVVSGQPGVLLVVHSLNLPSIEASGP